MWLSIYSAYHISKEGHIGKEVDFFSKIEEGKYGVGKVDETN
jgi:hypothetical protein